MSFFAELKRRNVVRVGLAYVVIGWVLAQIAEFAFENFGAPDWALKTFVVLLLLCLPLALFFAWAFEITPEGVKLEKNVDRSQSITGRTGRKLDFIIIGVLVVAVGFLLADRFTGSKDVAPTEETVVAGNQSIAVLPFVNMSDDKDYFADGLSEELLNLLAKIPNLKVAGRTSSFAFKGRNEDLRDIGDTLDVQHVLEGSVRRSGERLRITAQLIKVEDGYHIWSETYDRQMADVFDIQDDVANSITDALRLHLDADASRPTENPEAYALYLQALALQTYTSADDIAQALELLEQAIVLDPEFARAYELKSNFHWLQAGWLADGPTSQRLAYETASKAVELDPSLDAARSYAGTAHPDWTWIREFDALEELVRLQPANFSAIEALSYDFIVAGYYGESVRLAQQMIDLEPLSGLGAWRMGQALHGRGQLVAAQDYYTQAIELGSNDALWELTASYLSHGDDESAVIWLERYFTYAGLDPGEARPFIESVRNPDSGKQFLDQWVDDQLATATNYEEQQAPYAWYLAFGYDDDYWLAVENVGGTEVAGWTNSDTLEGLGMMFRESGYTRHPKFMVRAKASTLTDLWEERGPPDICTKINGEWTCQ